jgi:2-hydroxy-6-oxonona-2,4-dienedioate hydrolase
MQFALRHPERTVALVLVVPAAYPSHVDQRSEGATPARMSTATKWVFDVAMRSDFAFWLAPRLAPWMVTEAMLGTPAAVLERASPDERARAVQVGEHLLPISARRLGLLNDAAITPAVPRYELERISAPTLVISVADDLYGTYDGARFTADHIPGARFVGYTDGGHLWVGHQKEVMAEIVSFLKWSRTDPD